MLLPRGPLRGGATAYTKHYNAKHFHIINTHYMTLQDRIETMVTISVQKAIDRICVKLQFHFNSEFMRTLMTVTGNAITQQVATHFRRRDDRHSNRFPLIQRSH